MDRYPLNPDSQPLEETFFAKENAALLERLKAEAQQKQKLQAMREVVPNADDALLERLIKIGLKPETVLAMVLVPLAAVAWADGEIDARERAALVKAAEERGVKPGSAARQLLDTWLDRQPGRDLLETWKRYVKALYAGIEEKERHAVHAAMMDLARGVARSAGGFLGLGSKVSAAEKAVLDDLDKALA
jgi:hypothetical protein